MPIRALNDRKKLTADFNEANDAFIDEVLGALQGGRIDIDLARAYLAHPIASSCLTLKAARLSLPVLRNMSFRQHCGGAARDGP